MTADRTTPPGRRRADRADERAAAAVEFALVVPVLLLVVFGTIQYSLYFWAMQGGSDITRSAARLAAVSDPVDCAAFEDAVGAQVAGFAGAADDDPTVTRTYSDGHVDVGDLVTVTVEFDSIDLGLAGFIPFVENGTVSQSAQARVDYVDGTPQGCPP